MTRLHVSTRRETLPNGVVVERRTIVEKGDLEWRLQAAQVRALKALPEYASKFLLVGGMEAGRRGPQEAVRAKATGLTAGHPDVTIFLHGGRCAFIENKAENGRLSPAQKDRHTDLIRLGFDVVVVKCKTEVEAADAAVRLVRSWLGKPANDNGRAE